MDAYAGEVTSMHPFYAFDSPARATDMDLATTKAYAGENHISAGIQHGSWSMPLEAGKAPSVSFLSSNKQEIREDISYTNEDINHIIEWVKRHVETTWHSLGTCSMAPKGGNSIVKHGVLDERLNVHDVKGLKVADLSICPDNVGCNSKCLVEYTISRERLSDCRCSIFDCAAYWREVCNARSRRPWIFWQRVGNACPNVPCPS